MKIRNYMSIPENNIEAKKVLMSMSKEDVVDRYIYQVGKLNTRLMVFVLIAIGLLILLIKNTRNILS